MRPRAFNKGRDPPTPPLNERVPCGAYYRCFLPGIPLFLLARAFFGWLVTADAYPVLDRHAASLAWFTSTGLAHGSLLHST